MPSISSASHKYKLAVNILVEHFGPIVKEVGSFLLVRGKTTLPEILRVFKVDHPQIKPSLIRHSLLILLQHNLLDVKMPSLEELRRTYPKVFLYYQLEVDGILLRLRFPRFIERARAMHGEEGECILEELLFYGRLNMNQIRQYAQTHVMAKRFSTQGSDEEGKAAPMEVTMEVSEIQSMQAKIKKVVEEMIKTRHIVRVIPFELSNPAAPVQPIKTSSKTTKASSTTATTTSSSSTAKGKEDTPSQTTGTTTIGRKRKQPDRQDDDDVPVEILMMMQRSNGGTGSGGASSSSKGGAAASSSSSSSTPADSAPSSSGGPAKRGRGAARARGGRGGRGRGASTIAAGGGRGEASSSGANASKSDFVFDEESSDEEVKPDIPDAADDVLWKVGVDQFHRDFRHQVCERFVQQKVNSAAAAMVGAILRKHMPMERGVAEARTINVSIHDFKTYLPTNVATEEREKMAKMYMDHLKNDQVRIAGGGDGGKYFVYMTNIIESLKHRTLHSIISERYNRDEKAKDGYRNARICKVLLDKKYLDQGQISELAMMSPRETRERLYQMYRDELVAFQEVPKRADHNPGTTYYLWTMKMDQVLESVVDRFYKGLLNARLRQQKETEEKSDLLANRDNIRDAVEAEHFDKLSQALDRLDQAVINLDETVMLFTVF